MKIAFIGSGAWATALASVLAEHEDNEIVLYGKRKEEVDDINLNHKNAAFFPDVTLKDSITATLDEDVALKGAELLVLATPSSQIGNVMAMLKEHLDSKPLLVNVIKGFDPNTAEGITSVIKKALPNKDMVRGIVSLVGPSFAKDVIHHDNTCVCAVSDDLEAAQEVQRTFSSTTFRVYTNTDVIGAEIGAGMKNIIAIASGILMGLGYQDNARASLIPRGLAEITRYGVYKGAQEKTFLGLTGVGDLFLTCSSPSSRNYSFGLEIGKRGEAPSVLKENKKTVEGVLACKTIHEHAAKEGISTPIVDAVYAVLYEGVSPKKMAAALMERSLKAE